MLLSWSLIYKLSFSHHTFLIWNNWNILYKKQSLFFPNWFNNNITFVKHLFNSDRYLKSYSEFLSTYWIPVPSREFTIVLDAVPKEVLLLFKVRHHSGEDRAADIHCSVSESAVGKMCFSSKHSTSNRNIRSLFQKDIATTPYMTH